MIEYFDRMIPIHATLNSRKFGFPDQACAFHAKALQDTKYYIKTVLGIAKLHTLPTKHANYMEQDKGLYHRKPIGSSSVYH